MDKPDLAVRKKGIVLTMDALFALALLLISAMLIIVFLARSPAFPPPTSEVSSNLMASLKSLRMSELQGNDRYPYANYVITSNLTSTFNQTVIEAIADLYMANRTAEAYNLTREMLEPAVPSTYGIELLIENTTSNFTCIFNSTRGASRNQVSAGRHFIYYNNAAREVRLVVYS